MQSNGKKTTTTTGGAIVLVFSLPYHDRIKNPQKQIKFRYIYKVSKNFAKKVKKKLQIKILFVPLYRKQERTTNKHTNTMNTFNEIRAFELIKKISKEIENEHNALIDLMRKAEKFEIQPCKTRKEYVKLISAAMIDCNRICNVANKYFNDCGRVPSTVDNVNIYRIDSFSYIIKFFEL